MLAERTDALHVFCYASRKALIARTIKRDQLSAEEAAKLVDDTNRERERWVRLHWEREWRAHENYDLSVNTERLGIEGAADLIVAAARRQFGTTKGN
jgi:CMP/dCMP kinase